VRVVISRVLCRIHRDTWYEMSYRVKVYRLNDQGTWDDGGTGYVQLHSDEVGSYF